MNTLLALIQAIPDPVWSASLAAAATLAGVLVANYSNTKRLRVQLEHDAAEKARERLATLRREVYLDVAQELARANAFLASIPQQDPLKANLSEGLQSFFGAAAKVQLVAEPRTALLFMQLVGHYGDLLFKLLARARPMQDAKIQININGDLEGKAKSEVERVLAEMKRQSESGRPDEAAMAALRKSLDFHQTQSKLFATRQAAAWDTFTKLHEGFIRALFDDMKAVAQQQVEVQVAIRGDLGLSADSAALQQEMESQRRKVTEHLDKLLPVRKEAEGTHE